MSEDQGDSWSGAGWSGKPPRVGVPGAVCDGDMIALPDGMLLFSHPAGLSHMDDRHLNGSFQGSCFAYPRQVPGPACKTLAECPFAGDAPCRSNMTIIASRDGISWAIWAANFWPGFANAPWDPPGTDPEPFPARAGYSSMAFVRGAESASGHDEVALLFEATGEVGPLRLLRFAAGGPRAGKLLGPKRQ